MDAERFVAEARGLIGTPWRHRGRKPWAIDCIGLIVVAAKRAGLELNDDVIYGREPWDDALRRECKKAFGDTLPAIDPKPGDVVIVRLSADEPSHIGIIGDHPHGLSLIHAHNVSGVVEQRIDEIRAARIVEVYRPWV